MPRGGVPVLATRLTSVGAGAIAATNSVTTGTVDTTGGDFIVGGTSEYAPGTVGTPSDNKSNTMSLATNRGTLDARGRIFYKSAPSVGSGHTFSDNSSTATYPAIAAMTFRGLAPSPFDVENGATSGNTAVATLACGSIKPSTGNALVFAVLSYDGGTITNLAISGGFTIDTHVAYNVGKSLGLAIAWKIHSAGDINPTWTWTTARLASAALAAFKTQNMLNRRTGFGPLSRRSAGTSGPPLSRSIA